MARQPARDASGNPTPSRPSTRESIRAFGSTSPQDLFWDLLTFDRLMTGPVIHIIYWAGLCIFLLASCSVLGAAVGVAWREEGPMRWMLIIPLVVIGFLMICAGALIWRSVCEFYVAVFRIADDLRAMRGKLEAQMLVTTAPSRTRKAPPAAPEGPDGGL